MGVRIPGIEDPTVFTNENRLHTAPKGLLVQGIRRGVEAVFLCGDEV
jgi:hypothetical protein